MLVHSHHSAARLWGLWLIADPGEEHRTAPRSYGGRPDGVILHDALRIEPGEDDAYVALAPGHRALGTICEFGVPGNLEGPGSLWRASAASAADVVAQLARVR